MEPHGRGGTPTEHGRRAGSGGQRGQPGPSSFACRRRRAPRMAKTMVKIPNAAARPINVIRTIRITCCGSPSVDGLVKWGTPSIIGSLLFQDTEALRLDAEGYVERAVVDGRPSDRVSLRVSEEGAVSVYGRGRFPVTLYKEQWMKLLDVADEIRAFISEHDAELKTKDPK